MRIVNPVGINETLTGFTRPLFPGEFPVEVYMPPRGKKRVAEPPEAALPDLVRQRLAHSTCS